MKAKKMCCENRHDSLRFNKQGPCRGQMANGDSQRQSQTVEIEGL